MRGHINTCASINEDLGFRVNTCMSRDTRHLARSLRTKKAERRKTEGSRCEIFRSFCAQWRPLKG